jgi:hypothetical protein
MRGVKPDMETPLTSQLEGIGMISIYEIVLGLNIIRTIL